MHASMSAKRTNIRQIVQVVVTTELPAVAGRVADVKRWVVRASDTETAYGVVRERVALESIVTVTDELLSDEEITTFDLKPSQAAAF
jgi:hypothetical protein